jgi:hypothetical protein
MLAHSFKKKREEEKENERLMAIILAMNATICSSSRASVSCCTRKKSQKYDKQHCRSDSHSLSLGRDAPSRFAENPAT